MEYYDHTKGVLINQLKMCEANPDPVTSLYYFLGSWWYSVHFKISKVYSLIIGNMCQVWSKHIKQFRLYPIYKLISAIYAPGIEFRGI